MQRKKYTFIIVFFLFQSLLGQIKIQKYLSVEDGLSNNHILRTYYDKNGYMWFGTFNGVNRWDGKYFYKITKENGLVSSPVIDIIQSADGTIYFSNYTKGIIVYKDGILDTINTENGLAGNMVIRLRIHNGNPIFFSEQAQLLENGKLTTINYKVPKLKSRMSDFLQDDDGIYAACRDANNYAGFYVNDKYVDTVFTIESGLASSQVDLFEKNSAGDILLATAKGPNKYSKGKIYSIHFNGKSINTGITNDVHAGSDGTNYYVGDYGAIVEKNGTVEILTTENGLLENQITDISEDNNGTIYFGHENSGVSIYHPDRFSNYLSNDRSSKYIANTIIQSENGNILLGTQSRVSIIEVELNSTADQKLVNSLKNEFILAMKRSKDGKIIFGTKKGFRIYSNNHLEKYDLKRKSFYQDMNAIEISQDGDIILAERRLGLVVFTENNQSKTDFLSSMLNPIKDSDVILNPNQNYIKIDDSTLRENVKGGTLTYITHNNGLLSNRILDLLISSDSSLVIGFHGRGASIFKNGIFTNITSAEGLTDQIVNTVFEHSDGSYWFGTSAGGICIYKNKRIIDTLNVDYGLSSNDIRGIVEIDNKIYASTSNGLNVIFKYAGEYFIRQINESDGLPSNVCNINALYVDNRENIWIGTNKGVAKYNPQKDKVVSTPPKIYLSGIQLFNEEYPFIKFKNNPKLNYDQNYLKFIFTAVNLSAPDNVLFKYKLLGIDKNWVLSKTNNAQYTSLDDGQYTFQVKARNEWGYWSEPTSLSFVINPAWWETWWFYTLAFFAIGSLIAFISSYRYRHLLSVEKMRTKISADLHDSVGSGLSEISILSEMLGAQVNEEKKDFRSGLNNISSISSSLIESMSDIVWLVNPKKDTLKDLFKRLQLSYHEVLKYSDVDLLVQNLDDLENVRLPMNFRQHLYLIFKEAINNAIKYSGGDLLNLKIETAGNNLKVVFTDNGKGFELNSEKIGNGLVNMKNRAKEIGGDIKYFSEINSGTKVIFEGKFQKQKTSFI